MSLLAAAMRRTLKFIHTVSTATLVGALALQIVVAWRYTAGVPVGEVAAVGARQALAVVSQWVLLPSMVVCIVTGLLLMGSNRTYASAGWAWAKALLGLMLIKAVISINDPAARDLAAWALHAAANGLAAGDPAALAEVARLARMEWLGTWLTLALAVAAIAGHADNYGDHRADHRADHHADQRANHHLDHQATDRANDHAAQAAASDARDARVRDADTPRAPGPAASRPVSAQ
ncbi:MAG: CopD family protein [Burkholderiaceae bacterium]|nr:CopD family protein [Burkholderiaceae bacterium]